MTITQCDRCKRVIDDDFTRIFIGSRGMSDLKAIYDLCGTCKKSLYVWLDQKQQEDE